MRIGVDIGGTKIEAVLLDEEYRVVRSERVATEGSSSPEEIAEHILSCVREVFSDEVSGIGVGVPGFAKDGIVRYCGNLKHLEGVDLGGLLYEEFSVPVVCGNDANCFALAEHRLGAGRGSRLMLGVTIGTGVGGGIVMDGRLYRGASGRAAEFGRTWARDIRWEDVISGPAIIRRYREAGGSLEDPDPQMVWVSAEDFVAALKSEIVEDTARFFATLINCFAPERLVVGGGVSNLPYLEDVIAAVEKYCVRGTYEFCTISRFAISDSAGAIGAAMLLEAEKEKE